MDIGWRQSSSSNRPTTIQKMSSAKDLAAFFAKYPEDTLVFYSADMGGMPFSVRESLIGDLFSYYPKAFIYEDALHNLYWSEHEQQPDERRKACDLLGEREFVGIRPVLHFDV
jgi:hypothetical protein